MIILKSNDKITNYIPPCDIEEITLLSVEEANKLPKQILADSDWYWLRSPGRYHRYVANVAPDSFVYTIGFHVDSYDGGVRPVLKIKNLDSYNLKIGDQIISVGKDWYYIGNNLILCNNCIEYRYFNEDPDKPNANIFEGSDIQKWLINWLKHQIDLTANFLVYFKDIDSDNYYFTDSKEAVVRKIKEKVNENYEGSVVIYNLKTSAVKEIYL